MASIQYYVDYNEQTIQTFNSLYKQKPGMNEIRKMRMNADGTYEVKPINAVSLGNLSFDDYAKLAKTNGYQLVVFVDRQVINYFNKESIHMFSHQSSEGIDFFNKIDFNKKSYKLMNRMFRPVLGRSAYKTVLVSKDDKKKGFVIEQYPDTLELKMDIVDRSKKEESIEGGIYLSIEGGGLRNDLDKYTFNFTMGPDGSFELASGRINILPKNIPSNLPVLEKNQYILILKKSLPVAIKVLDDGNYSVRLVTKNYVPIDGEETYYMIPDYEKFILESKNIGAGILNTIETLEISSNGIKKSKSK